MGWVVKRGGRLKVYAPLVRKTLLRQVSTKRAGEPAKRTRSTPAVSADVREMLIARAAGWCEIALPGCLGWGTDPAHRIARKAGGRKRAGRAANDRASNALWSCRACHNWTESQRTESYELGVLLREGQEPTQEPVVRRGVLVYLTDCGGVHDFEAVGA